MLNEPPLVRVEIDVYLMRRKTVHAVMNADGDTLSHHDTLGGLFSWLHENNYHHVLLVDETTEYLVDFRVSPSNP